MTPESLLVEMLHWLATASFIASVALNFLPTPDEVPGRAWLVIYSIIRRVAANKGWVHRNGNGQVSAADAGK